MFVLRRPSSCTYSFYTAIYIEAIAFYQHGVCRGAEVCTVRSCTSRCFLRQIHQETVPGTYAPLLSMHPAQTAGHVGHLHIVPPVNHSSSHTPGKGQPCVLSRLTASSRHSDVGRETISHVGGPTLTSTRPITVYIATPRKMS